MRFELWRQDDNGQRFLVGRYQNLDEARRRLAELALGRHKQIYWIAEATDSNDRTEQ